MLNLSLLRTFTQLEFTRAFATTCMIKNSYKTNQQKNLQSSTTTEENNPLDEDKRPSSPHVSLKRLVKR